MRRNAHKSLPKVSAARSRANQALYKKARDFYRAGGQFERAGNVKKATEFYRKADQLLRRADASGWLAGPVGRLPNPVQPIPLFCSDCDRPLDRATAQQLHDRRWVCPRCKEKAIRARQAKDQARLFEDQESLFRNPGRVPNVEGYRDAVGVFHPIRADKEHYNEFAAGDFSTPAERREKKAKHDSLKSAAFYAESNAKAAKQFRKKARSLSQFVRASGGIAYKARQRGSKGSELRTKRGTITELGMLSPTETGTTGLLNKTNRRGTHDAERMMDAANVEGYRDRNGHQFRNIGDFIAAVSEDAAGTHKIYTIEDLSDYGNVINPAPPLNEWDFDDAADEEEAFSLGSKAARTLGHARRAHRTAARFFFVTWYSPLRGKRTGFVRPIEAHSAADAKRQAKAMITNDPKATNFVAKEAKHNPAKAGYQWQHSDGETKTRVFATKAEATQACRIALKDFGRTAMRRWKLRKVKVNPTVSQKISQLRREGVPQKQAVAVALSEKRAGKVNPKRGGHPYDPSDMNAAVAYAAKTRALFEAGKVRQAWDHYRSDPNGTNVAAWRSLEKFTEMMRKHASKNPGRKRSYITLPEDTPRARLLMSSLARWDREAKTSGPSPFAADRRLYDDSVKELEAMERKALKALKQNPKEWRVRIGEADQNSEGLPSYYVETIDGKRGAIFSMNRGGHWRLIDNTLTRDEANEAHALVDIRHDQDWPKRPPMVVANPSEQHIDAGHVTIVNPAQQDTGPFRGGAGGFRLKDDVIDKKTGRPAFIFSWLIGKKGDPHWVRIVFTDGVGISIADRSIKDLTLVKSNPGLVDLAANLQAADFVQKYIGGGKRRRNNPVDWNNIARFNFTFAIPGGAWLEDASGNRNWFAWDAIDTHMGTAWRKRQLQKQGSFTGTWIDVDNSIARKPIKRNPSIKALSQTFQGKANGHVSEYKAANSAPSDLARIGKLVFLKLSGGKQTRVPGGMVAVDSKGKLWLTAKRAPVFTKKAKPGTMLDFGPVDQICYETAKAHIESGRTTEYVHKFGEDGGKRPHLLVDAEGMPILRGGDYQIKSEGIVN